MSDVIRRRVEIDTNQIQSGIYGGIGLLSKIVVMSSDIYTFVIRLPVLWFFNHFCDMRPFLYKIYAICDFFQANITKVFKKSQNR
jgi:hypothetical protein